MDVRLRCLLINTELKVLLNPFWLTVPVHGHHAGLIFTFLRAATPSLRGVSDSRFSLYKPLATLSSRQLTRLTEAEVDLGAPVEMSFQIGDIFPEGHVGNSVEVDAIICLDHAGQDTAAPIVLLPSQACNGPHSLVTILSWDTNDVQRPAFYILTDNYISQTSSLPVPEFVRTFENLLSSKRSPELSMTPDFAPILKEQLGNEVNILINKQLTCLTTYTTYKGWHLYSLLMSLSSGLEGSGFISFDKPWPFHLIIRGNNSYQYLPRSDFCMAVKNLPVLLLQMESDPDQTDKNRMLLQAGCLVRLGNALLKGRAHDFMVKAVYIDSNYRATEYTLYEKETSLQRYRPEIDHTQRNFNLTKPMEAFEFIFRLYNFRSLCQDISDQFSDDAAHVLSFVAKRARSYPPLPLGPDNTSSPQTTQSGSVASGSHIDVSRECSQSPVPAEGLQERLAEEMENLVENPGGNQQ